ncbi:uncharacterized protein LOC111475919, partial [Cucurbita maxima]|uniref:Uncharacterized protein LOC111475919 n=1 Tax=Cucurbita maxima TaxID=3661 RepID=A0A6J1ILF4_CUCMA
MDDFDVVLGMEFLLEHKVIPMPLAKCLVITDRNPTVIPASIKQPVCHSIPRRPSGLQHKPRGTQSTLEAGVRQAATKPTISMDSDKIKAIQEWKVPTSVSDLRSFLGLANYYRRFVEGFSRRAAPLIELLKKDHTWSWSDDSQMAFEDLKTTMTRGPVLGL